MDPITFVILDSGILTNGMRVMVDGVDTTQFEKNPVMLYDHDDWNLPIGTWTNIRKENGRLLADAVFDVEDQDEKTQRIIGKVQRGVIKACTPGLVDLECSDDPMLCEDGDCCLVVMKCRLREISITPIGKGMNALKLYDKSGSEIKYKENPSLLLSDFIVSPKIKTNMDKIYLQTLNLSDKATDQDVDTAVKAIISERDGYKTKLDELLLADKTAKRQEFEKELDQAFKDGRLAEKPEGDKLTPVRDRMLNLYDKDSEGTITMLSSIPAPTALDKLNLGDKADQYKELAAMSWEDIDKKGKMLLCKDTYPELYKEKFKAKFGVEPNM